MSDWAPGDLALCVNNRPIAYNKPRHLAALSQLAAGGIYRVVGFGKPGSSSTPSLFLDGPRAADENKGFGWAASRFRKIRPHTPDAEDRRTIELLTGKPAKVDA